MAEPLLDCERIRALRLEAGMTQLALAREVGMSPPTIRSLEDPTRSNHHVLQLGAVVRVAAVLGVPLQKLLLDDAAELDKRPPPSTTDSAADAAKVGALIAAIDDRLRRRDIAMALGWDFERVVTATRLLQHVLGKAGLRFPSGASTLSLLPNRSLLDADELRAAGRALLGRGSMRVNEAWLLREIAAGVIDGRWEGRATNPQRVVLSRLLGLGLIVKQGARFSLSEEARLSLLPPPDGGSQVRDG